MNRTFRFFLAAALALSPFAPASVSASTGDDVLRGPYEPTRFGDNTFIDVQGGVNAFGASNMTRGDVWSSVRPSAALGVSLGKWFVPSVGLRVGWQGLMSNWAPGADFTPALPQMRGWYNYAHADLLVDCCNWFGGFRRERTWSVVPYLSVGAAWNYIPPIDGHNYNYAFITDENPVRTAYSGICSVAFGAGLYNCFRISDRVGITLDVRAVAHDRDLLGAAVNYGIDRSGSPVREAYKARGMEIFGGNLSAMVGVCVALGPVGWKRRGTPDDAISSAGNFAAVPVPSAEPVQTAPSQDATHPCTVADGDAVKAADDGEPLARAVETGGTPDKAIADGTYRRPAGRKSRRSSEGGLASSGGEEGLAFAFFSVAKYTMTREQILEWEQEISGLDKSADYDVVGYADITTGSMSINNRLRRRRAATVVSLLRERGFTGRLTPGISGGTETMFEIAWKNCAAVIRPVSRGTVKPAEEVRTEELFGWQIMSGKTRIPSDDRCFLGYEPTVVEVGGGILKYIIGVSGTPAGAYENKVEIRKKYPDAFLVRISNGVSPYYYKP